MWMCEYVRVKLCVCVKVWVGHGSICVNVCKCICLWMLVCVYLCDWVLYLHHFICVCECVWPNVWECEYMFECVHAMAHGWQSGDNLRRQFLPATLFETGFHGHCVLQSRWPLHLLDSPASISHLIIRALLLQTCLVFTWAQAIWTHALVLLW